jgi:hypothetical protein
MRVRTRVNPNSHAERFLARGTALKVVVVSNAPIAVPRAGASSRAAMPR